MSNFVSTFMLAYGLFSLPILRDLYSVFLLITHDVPRPRIDVGIVHGSIASFNK
jgi:hypothetical protein